MSKIPNNDTAQNHKSEMVKLINKLAPKYGVKNVFQDFLASSALSVSNSIDLAQRQAREKQYLEIVGKYQKTEVELFPEMFANLVMALEEHSKRPRDILGDIYQNMELTNGRAGQVFTPNHICDFIGKVTFGEYSCEIEENGYVSVCEPCCGAGAIVLGFAGAMRDAGYNINEHIIVTAVDTDIWSVYMCYLQLSLYGIPAIVIHGNSLTNEEWSRWYTPLYVIGSWAWRKPTATETAVEMAVNPRSETVSVVSNYGCDVILRETESGQFTLNVGA
jgi:type I restriction-modification system DNA methylase subunit